nr:hypothetical protein [Tanacetum cinerariifolium]
MTLLNTLMETYATLSQKVSQLEQDKITQALEILKLKKNIKKLEKKRKSKSSSLKRLRKVGGKIKAVNTNDDIILVDVETQKEVADMDAKLQGRIYDVSVAATKDVNPAEPTVLDVEEVTMTMAQKLIKMKAEKARLLDEQMAKRKYRSLKRKPVSIAQARKNMIIYLKNMVGYKIKHFRGMTYDKESFKKLKAVEVLGFESIQETPTNDPKEMSKDDVQNMLEIFPVSKFKVEALQVKYPLIDWEIHSEGSRTYWKIIKVGGIIEAYQSFEDMIKVFDREDMVALWRLVKEKFNSAVPNVDKEKAL